MMTLMHNIYIYNSKGEVLSRSALTVSAKCLTVPKLVYKFSIFSRCKDTCTCFSKCYIIKQLLTNEALDMM